MYGEFVMKYLIALMFLWLVDCGAADYGTLRQDNSNFCSFPIFDETSEIAELQEELNVLNSRWAPLDCSLSHRLNALKARLMQQSNSHKQSLLAYCNDHSLLVQRARPWQRFVIAGLLFSAPAVTAVGTAISGYGTAALASAACTFAMTPSIPLAIHSYRIECEIINPARAAIYDILSSAYHEDL